MKNRNLHRHLPRQLPRRISRVGLTTTTELVSSSYHVKTQINNCFIIYYKNEKNTVVGHICMQKPFCCFTFPLLQEVDVVIGMTS